IQSILFDILFYTVSALILFVIGPFAYILPQRMVYRVPYYWARLTLWMLRKIAGITIEYKGTPPDISIKPQECVIFACQHESALDVIFPYTILPAFTVVMKKELTYIPFLGVFHNRMQSIFIDRKNGHRSVRSMLDKAKNAFTHHRHILIYPQGHRYPFGAPGPVQGGVFLLYKHLSCRVIPIRLNTGKNWQRKGVFKKPGKVTIEFGDPIEQGLDKQTLIHRLNTFYREQYGIYHHAP
ncbi:MAG: lysophospholipid acyltransferase family protein, partial [Alphaproteobacteria bacterium]|nr:lysophospholipid acyltransferase family protein [Alphaproteobacteria bacterium]